MTKKDEALNLARNVILIAKPTSYAEHKTHVAAVEAIDKALAEPAQEPVFWMETTKKHGAHVIWDAEYVRDNKVDTSGMRPLVFGNDGKTKLYTKKDTA